MQIPNVSPPPSSAYLNAGSILEGFSDKGQHYIICSAIGHLYRLIDITKNFNIDPRFDLDWIPVYSKHRRMNKLRHLIETVSKISENATDFIHACDYDQELDKGWTYFYVTHNGEREYWYQIHSGIHY
jgi:DNA topoisomerase IA